MWWWLFIGIAAIAAPVLYFAARRNERATLHDWELVLTPKGEESYKALERKVRSDLTLSDVVYERAFTEKARGSEDEAIRLLDVGCKLIESFSPTMVRSLAAMAVLSRMVSAMTPVKPMRPLDFRLRQMTNLAQVGRFAQHLMRTNIERFRLKMQILARGFRLLSRMMFAATYRAEPAWETIQAARQDMQTLAYESLDSFRNLLIALDAQDRPEHRPVGTVTHLK